MPLLNSSGRYQLQKRLHGHQDAILSLGISKDGSFLASGGEDGTRLWCMDGYKAVTRPEHGLTLRGQSSCLTWAMRKDDNRNILAFGTGNGYLVIWWYDQNKKRFEEVYSRQIGTAAEITCICWNAENGSTVQFANGTRDSGIFVWKLEGRALLPQASLKLGLTVPRNIGFLDPSGDECYIFGAYNGQWQIVKVSEKQAVITHDLNKALGHGSVGRNQFVVDNAYDGFDLHQIEDGAYVRTFKTGLVTSRKPKQVLFGENSQVVVGGSDHGAVYVFDRKSGNKLDVLRHSEKGLVQIVTVHENDGINVIAAASPDLTGQGIVNVWTCSRPHTRAHRAGYLVVSIKNLLQILMQIIVVMAAAAILRQNVYAGNIPHPCNWLPCGAPNNKSLATSNLEATPVIPSTPSVKTTSLGVVLVTPTAKAIERRAEVIESDVLKVEEIEDKDLAVFVRMTDQLN